MTTYTFQHVAPEADAVVIAVTENELKQLQEGHTTIVPVLDQHIKQLIQSKVLRAKVGSCVAFPSLGILTQAVVVITVVGEERGALREAFATAATKLKSYQVSSVALQLNSEGIANIIEETQLDGAIKQVIEGFKLSLYERQKLKKEEHIRHELQNVTFVLNEQHTTDLQQIELAAQEAEHMVESVKLARDLTNMSGNELTPERLAYYAEEIASKLDLDIEVMDEWTCAEEQMGGLLGVGQGSVNPPRMIVIHYEGDPASTEKWGLIGKGITFDTGGISLKPAAGMEEMISDMGGAAAVLGAIHAIASNKVKANVIVVIPTAENMPSDRALKPGDIIRTMSGHTVEVVNTDAEGRLVLADGITTAIKRGATKLIDVATLTGAVLVALGTEATGAVTNNDELMAQITDASAMSGERVWQLPAYTEYKKLIASDVADLKNSGGRHAGTITAGLFLGHFVEDKPWVHLDIAGTAYVNNSRKWEPKGGTGVMVRTLHELISKKNR